MERFSKLTRREWLASVAMGVGVVLSYGLLGLQGLSFLLPRRLRAKTRSLFAGNVSEFPPGSVQERYDLEGNKILVQAAEGGFRAFSSVCPHLGCRVHWSPDEAQFVCPCHNGIFDKDGRAVSGPPAAEGQVLGRVPVRVDDASGSIFLEVKDAPSQGRQARG